MAGRGKEYADQNLAFLGQGIGGLSDAARGYGQWRDRPENTPASPYEQFLANAIVQKWGKAVQEGKVDVQTGVANARKEMGLDAPIPYGPSSQPAPQPGGFAAGMANSAFGQRYDSQGQGIREPLKPLATSPLRTQMQQATPAHSVPPTGGMAGGAPPVQTKADFLALTKAAPAMMPRGRSVEDQIAIERFRQEGATKRQEKLNEIRKLGYTVRQGISDRELDMKLQQLQQRKAEEEGRNARADKMRQFKEMVLDRAMAKAAATKADAKSDLILKELRATLTSLIASQSRQWDPDPKLQKLIMEARKAFAAELKRRGVDFDSEEHAAVQAFEKSNPQGGSMAWEAAKAIGGGLKEMVFGPDEPEPSDEGSSEVDDAMKAMGY